MAADMTDGRSFVYALFDADGYECKSLVGLFSTQELAEAAAEPLRKEQVEWWAGSPVNRGQPDPRTFSVELLELDKADAR